MGETIRCSECEHCKMNRPFGNSRGEFWCQHENQKYIIDFYKQNGIHRATGFIAFGKPWDDVPTTKTSPKWCPRKEVQ